ncbi:GDYXXLXY domain-containing protein [Phormidesmis sp. 146-35]
MNPTSENITPANPTPANPTVETAHPLPQWRFWLPLVLQTVLIASVPAQAVYTHLTGRTAVLQTAPVDPYDLMRGYSVTLNYDISRTDNLKSLPGWKSLPKNSNYSSTQDYLAEDTIVYVTLQAPANNSANRPKPWKPVAVSGDRPANLKPNQIALKGRSQYGSLQFGLETYYMPESRRDEVNDNIQQNQRKNPGVVEVKIDAQGNAVPLTIWVGDRRYSF